MCVVFDAEVTGALLARWEPLDLGLHLSPVAAQWERYEVGLPPEVAAQWERTDDLWPHLSEVAVQVGEAFRARLALLVNEITHGAFGAAWGIAIPADAEVERDGQGV